MFGDTIASAAAVGGGSSNQSSSNQPSDRSKMKTHFMDAYRRIYDANPNDKKGKYRHKQARKEAENETKYYISANTDYKHREFNVKFKKNKEKENKRLSSGDFDFWYPYASDGQYGGMP